MKEHQFNVDAELESAQGQVVISNLVLDLTSQLFNALGASASSQVKQLDRFWRNARTVSSHNPLIYKEKVIGDWEVNRTDLPFVWQLEQAHGQNLHKIKKPMFHRLFY